MAKTKKEAILTAALELFVSNGIDATSIRSIAEGADTAEGNIYRHFKNKDDLARTIFLNCATKFRDRLKTRVTDENEPEQKISVLVRTIFDFAFENEREFSYLLIANHREEIITREMLSKPLPKDIFINIIQEGQNQGVFQSFEDPTIVVAWLIGMVQRSIIFTQRNMISLKHDKMIDDTVNAALRMLKR